MNFKALLNISSKYPNPTRNLQCSEFEIDSGIISEFILKELIPIVGIHPYPLNELMLMTAALCVIKPTHIFEWGTHVGKSARIFYEVTKHFNIACKIHSIDLPDNVQHKEHPQQNRGLLVKNIPEIKLHQGEGFTASLSLYKKISTKSYPLFFLDGDHDYYSVKRELKGIIKNISNASILIHDTFYQSNQSKYNIGPYRAVHNVLKRMPNKYKIISNNIGLPGITLIYENRNK